MHILLGNIGKRQDCKKSVEWYYEGTVKKQANFIAPLTSSEEPPGQSRSAWITEKVEAFRLAIKNFREAGL